MDSRVFLVHQPSRWSLRNQRMEPLDMSPAEHYGEIVVAFPGLDRPPCSQQALPVLRRLFGDYKPSDYLIIAGDMDLLVWASYLAMRAAGCLKLLRWNGRKRLYEVSEAPVELFD